MKNYSVVIIIAFFLTGRQEVGARTETANMQDLCGTTVEKTDALRLRSHQSVGAFNGDELAPRCTFVLQALKTSQRFLIQMEHEYFILEDATAPRDPASNSTRDTPSYCNSSFFQIWDGDDVTDDVEPLVAVCGRVVPAAVVESRTQFVTVRLTVHPTATVNVTVLTSSFDTGPCTDEVTELRCRNGRCVPLTVRCDSADNCGDSTDQLVSAPANCTLATIKSPVNIPWGILLGALAAILAAFGLYWLFWRPGYLIWRLACCRNLAHGCCHCCSCGRGTKCCCLPMRSFSGSGPGNGDGDEKSGRHVGGSDENSRETARSEPKEDRVEKGSTWGQGRGCFFCPCGRGGGGKGHMNSGEHGREEGGGWTGQGKNIEQGKNKDVFDNGGDGGHARECR